MWVVVITHIIRHSYTIKEGDLIMVTAYACGSGGVMFVPEKIERTMPAVVMRRSNDNDTQEDQE